MSKLLGIVLASAVSLTLLTFAVLGAEWIAHAHLSHPGFNAGWWIAVSEAIASVGLTFAALKLRRRRLAEPDAPLTPLVRRSPETGLRQL